METSPSSVGIEPLPCRAFALIVGSLLLIEGVWGLFSDVVFGVLTTNRLHAVIHIVLGLIGVLTCRKDASHGFAVFIGALLIAVGVLRFVPLASDLVIRSLNVNPAVAVVNLVIGIIALVVTAKDRSMMAARSW